MATASPNDGRLSANDSGKPPAINTLRHQLLPSRLRPTPNAVAAHSAMCSAVPCPSSCLNTSQAAAQVSTAGSGQVVSSLSAGTGRQAFNQAIEFVQRSELDNDLAHLFHAARALDAFLHLNLHLGHQQV